MYKTSGIYNIWKTYHSSHSHPVLPVAGNPAHIIHTALLFQQTVEEGAFAYIWPPVIATVNPIF